MKDSFYFLKDLHSLPRCLNELCLKSITDNKIDTIKLTVKRLKKEKGRCATLPEIIFMECDLGTRFII